MNTQKAGKKILYKTFLKNMRGCPFCSPHRKNESIAENRLAYLTYALAPYSPYHLLAIPKRHVENIKQLTAKERDAIEDLVEVADRILAKKGVENYSVLVRNGKHSFKSIPHIHYNIIPNHHVGDLDINMEQRRVLSPEETEKLITSLRKAAKNSRIGYNKKKGR